MEVSFITTEGGYGIWGTHNLWRQKGNHKVFSPNGGGGGGGRGAEDFY